MYIRILFSDSGDNFHIHCNAVLRGAEHLNKRIDMDTGRSNVILFRFFHNKFKYLQTVVCSLRNTCVVAEQCDNFPVFVLFLCHNREDRIDLIALSGNRVKKSRSLAVAVNFCQYMSAGAVNRDGKIRNFLNAVDHPF